MQKDTIDKAYGNIPKEISPYYEFDIIPFRSIRYYWILLKRKLRALIV